MKYIRAFWNTFGKGIKEFSIFGIGIGTLFMIINYLCTFDFSWLGNVLGFIFILILCIYLLILLLSTLLTIWSWFGFKIEEFKSNLKNEVNNQ